MFQKRKEMEIISRALEDLINGKTLEIALPNQDTLPAKVQHQLVRLSDIIRGTQEKAWKERNQIKELIAETAHQLRNPLANMESYLELLQEEGISREEQEIYLEALCASETRIRFLTEGFIKMSRLENHIVQIKRTGRFDGYGTQQSASSEKGCTGKEDCFFNPGRGSTVCVS